jgi:hypothetical protein
MTFAEVMAQERGALIAEYLFPEGLPGLSGVNVAPYAAIQNFEILKTTPRYLRTKHPVQVSELFDSDRGHAFVQSCPTLGYNFLWTHVANNNDRADYVLFLQQQYGLSVTAVPETHHVVPSVQS